MKRTITLILFTLFFAISVVVALHIAIPKKENHKHAAFDRMFASETALQPLDTLNLGRHGYYFAGTALGQVFLANRDAVGYVLEVNAENFRDTIYHIIKADSLKYQSIRVKVNTPYFYLMDGYKPFIYRGKITDWTVTPYIDSIYFFRALPVSDSSFALIKINNFKTTFHKITKGVSEPEIFTDLLEEQGEEGVFSTDGKLHFDGRIERLVYVYNYRNQYLCMDTNFNLLYKGSTIDTISQAKIKVSNINSENTMTMSAPPLKVNNESCIYDNLLYINSNILAANEEVAQFESASVIDAYYLKDGSYQYSFYLPLYDKKKAEAFKIIENCTVLALYGHYIVSYKFPAFFKKKNSLTIN